MADDAIGWLRPAFDPLGEVRPRAGRSIDRAALQDADALLVRTITRVDPALVQGTSIGFVGSATAGLDHVDRPGLQSAGVRVAHAPGCNANAVVEYVLGALARLDRDGVAAFPPRGPVGIVGFGAIGRRLARVLRSLGVVVLVCDPPLSTRRAAPDEPDDELRAMIADEGFVSRDELLATAEVVTLHVPRVDAGPHRTRHWLDEAGLAALPPGAVVINTSRGGVADDRAVERWLVRGGGAAVLDVWEAEPSPPASLLERVALATPHVAGYSVEGKLEATRRVHVALAAWLHRPPSFDPASILAALPVPALAAVGGTPSGELADALVRAVDLQADDAALRTALQTAGDDPAARAIAFEHLRRTYALRREVAAFEKLPGLPLALASALSRITSPAPAR